MSSPFANGLDSDDRCLELVNDIDIIKKFKLKAVDFLLQTGNPFLLDLDQQLILLDGFLNGRNIIHDWTFLFPDFQLFGRLKLGFNFDIFQF